MKKPMFGIAAITMGALLVGTAPVNADHRRDAVSESGTASYLHVRHRAGNAVHERAHRYAAIAVRQSREARYLGLHDDHPRWTSDYRDHFRWALGARNHEIDREIRRRVARLRELRRDVHGPRHRARHYRP